MNKPKRKLIKIKLFSTRFYSHALLLIWVMIWSIMLIAEANQKRFVRVFFPNGCSLIAELAITEEERQLGLMFREKINPDQGMLFVFEKEDILSFWMKNMNFPLDILWLNQEKRIVHMESHVPPCQDPDCPSYFSPFPAMYVLELKKGSVETNQLKLYDKIEFILPDGLRHF